MTDVCTDAAHLHRHVPPDWYHTSIKKNFFQRFWHHRRFQEVKKLAEPVSGNILDVGCADGVFSDVILQATGALSLIGVDALTASVEWAKGHWAETPMRFQVADAHALPFPDNSFAAVFCMEMLEHVSNPHQVLQEMLRVLRPQGYALVLVPTDSPLFRLIWFFWTKFRGRIWHDTHIQSFQGHALRNVMKNAGFTIECEHRFLLGMLCAVKGRKSSSAMQE